MANQLSPSIVVTEAAAEIIEVPAIAASIGGFVGKAERGPVHTAVLCTSFPMFERIFGGNYTGYLWESVRAFFQNGGERCYVVRVTHLTSVSDKTTFDGVRAFVTLQNSTPTNTLTVTAAAMGLYGNNLKIISVRRDRKITTTAEASGAGARTSILLTSTTRVNIGAQLRLLDGGGDNMRVVVTGINGNSISFASSTPTADIASGADVYLETFDLTLTDEGSVVASWVDCYMNVGAGASYVENMINDTDDPESLITVDELLVAATNAIDPRPANTPATGTALASGTDGGAVVDADIVGSETGRSGCYAMNDAKDLNLMSIPGETSATVMAGFEVYLKYRGTVLGIVEPPISSAPAAVITWLNTTVNLGYDNVAVLYPWLKISDPDSGAPVVVPPCGFWQGLMAQVERKRKLSKAPAGIRDGKLVGVLGVERIIETTDYDTLYPEGVNCIQRTQSGYCVMGDRTLGIPGDLRYVGPRRVTNLVVRTADQGFRWVLFEDADEDLQKSFKRSMGGFLIQQWKGKNLDGNKASEAFYIICDNSLNTEAVKRSKKFKARIGLRHKNSVNFAEFTVEQDLRALQAELASAGL